VPGRPICGVVRSGDDLLGFEVHTGSSVLGGTNRDRVGGQASFFHDQGHSTTLERVRSIAVFFDPAMIDGGDRVRILAATNVLREMIVYAGRWPIDRPASDPVAEVVACTCPAA